MGSGTKIAEVCYGCRNRLRHNVKIMLVRITRWSGSEIHKFHERCGLTAINMTTNTASDKKVAH